MVEKMVKDYNDKIDETGNATSSLEGSRQTHLHAGTNPKAKKTSRSVLTTSC